MSSTVRLITEDAVARLLPMALAPVDSGEQARIECGDLERGIGRDIEPGRE